MKRFLLLLLTNFFIVSSFSQSRTELGMLIGTSYYHGDINHSTLFYSPSLAYGLIVKYNLSDHLSSTLNVSYGKLKGNDGDFNQIENQLRGASFSSGIIDVNAIIEFNFLPYNSSGYIKKNKKRFSPYIFMGIGGNYLTSSGGFENPITIPFGLGIKYNIFERLTLGVEWSYSKTFDDEIDGVVNIQDENHSSVIHNDDWYSFCGIFITYKIFKDKIDCPTYSD